MKALKHPVAYPASFPVPTFDPSKDDVQIYAQKVKLVTTVWPANKISELITRLILNTRGSAFSKLQLHQSELCVNDQKAVERLIEILGGYWGRTGLEKRYTDAEKAMYHIPGTCRCFMDQAFVAETQDGGLASLRHTAWVPSHT